MMMEVAEVEKQPASPGQMLRAAREAKGWKVEQVASQLKLSRRQIEALEADAFADLPGLTFVRGFVRNYARVLEIDTDPILALLERHASPDTTFEIKAPPLAKLPKGAGGYPGQSRPPYRL
ncbi:MAG: helix-turn-helix domain-containing protein, partial [Neisseriaceae bacterium]